MCQGLEPIMKSVMAQAGAGGAGPVGTGTTDSAPLTQGTSIDMGGGDTASNALGSGPMSGGYTSADDPGSLLGNIGVDSPIAGLLMPGQANKQLLLDMLRKRRGY